MAEAQDVDSLKRRGRRRLVGALALVLLAVIVLPMVFDPEPRRGGPPVSVRIPGEDDTPFTPKMAKAPEKKLEEKKTEEKKPEEKKVEEKKVEAKAEEKPEIPQIKPAPAERSTSTYVIPVGAFANPDPVLVKLKEAKLPYFTESVAAGKGTVTRVRAGPFASKDTADKAMEKLKGLGFKPGNLTTGS
jgi:DedD protein